MSLEYIRVLDDRISSLLKAEGLVITILVATVSITSSFGVPIAVSWIILSLKLFFWFFVITSLIYAALSIVTFKKREESSEKYDNLLIIRRWQNNYESITAKISEDFLFTTIDNKLQRKEFLETQPYDMSPLVTNVMDDLRSYSVIKSSYLQTYGVLKDVLLDFQALLNKAQDIRNQWAEGKINFKDASRKLYEKVSTEYGKTSQLSKNLVKAFEGCVIACYIFFAIAVGVSLLVFIRTLSTLPVTSN